MAIAPDQYGMKVIARIRTGFPSKFGIPRQSGLVDELAAQVIFEPDYRNPDALRGLEEYSHVWLVWVFSEAVRDGWSPTVRPPRLGGNQRMGVFATRSPFRPNPIGLSAVRLLGIDPHTPEGPVLRVGGADLMDGTPILDIKPYLPFADSRPGASEGFAGRVKGHTLAVRIPGEIEARLPPDLLPALRGILAEDPRPSYQDDPGRVYRFEFEGYRIGFRAAGGEAEVLEAEEVLG